MDLPCPWPLPCPVLGGVDRCIGESWVLVPFLAVHIDQDTSGQKSTRGVQFSWMPLTVTFKISDTCLQEEGTTFFV